MEKTSRDYCGEFGTLLYQSRVKAKKSRQDVASKLGVSTNTVPHWEDGTVLPAKEKLITISAIYVIDETVLAKAFTLARQQKDFRKSLHDSRKSSSSSDMFSGGNSQVAGGRRTSAHYSLHN